MVCLRSRSTLWADVAPGLSSSSRQRGVLGSQSAIPDDGRRHALPSHSFAVLNILECSFVNYIMSHPLLHSAISSSPVIAGFNYGLRDTNLPRVRLQWQMTPSSRVSRWPTGGEKWINDNDDTRKKGSPDRVLDRLSKSLVVVSRAFLLHVQRKKERR